MTSPTSADYGAMPVRRFGRVNWLGTATLAAREIRRFMTVWQQTVLAPLMTARSWACPSSSSWAPAS